MSNEIKAGPFAGQVPVFIDEEPVTLKFLTSFNVPGNNEEVPQDTVAVIITNGLKFAGVYLELNEAENLLSGVLEEIRAKIKEQV